MKKKKMLKMPKMNILALIYLFVIVIGLVKTYRETEVVATFAMPTNKKVIVIDAGHGGWVPCC